MRDAKIAILVPTFNGGALLAETVASPAEAGLPPGSYEILVIDNHSDDGSIDALPVWDRGGAPIHLHRNGVNLGRVQNWNRALELARAMGFRHALFLMAGDRVRDASLLALRERMRGAGAAMGLASYEIVDEALRPSRVARRILWPGDAAIPAKRFLSQTLAVGAALFGPLGANLYDLDAAPLRFDPADPSHTDQAATIEFLRCAGRPVVYLDSPITQWRMRAGRFHNGMDFGERLARDRAVIARGCRDSDVVPDEKKIRCTFLLRILFHARGDLSRLPSHLQRYKPVAGPTDWLWMLRLLTRQVFFRTPWRVTR